MKKYFEPVLEIVAVGDDIITASNCGNPTTQETEGLNPFG